MSLYLDMHEHLLPRAVAWRLLPVSKTLRKLFEGLSGAPQHARGFVDLVHADLFPLTTRALAEWEAQFGLTSDGTDTERRLRLAAVWRAQGGQSPRYLQDVVQAAGFPLYIHEWWWPPNEAPRTARSPLDYTEQPLIGSIQCGEPLALCGEPEAQCNRWLVNDVRYIQNSNLTPEAPAAIPADPAYWPYFIYWGAETFPNDAQVPQARRAELAQLLLKITPAHLWNVLLVDWTPAEPAEPPSQLYALSSFSPTSFYQTAAGGGDAGMSNVWGFAVLFYLRALPTSLERVFGRSNDVDKGWRVVVDASGKLRAYVTAGNGSHVASPPWQFTASDVGKVHGLVIDKTAGNFYTYVNRVALGGISLSSYTSHNGPTIIGASEGGANPAQSIDVLAALTFNGNPTAEQVAAIFDAAKNGDYLSSVPGAALRDRWSLIDVLTPPVTDGGLAPAQLPETTAGASEDLMVRQGSPIVRMLNPEWAW